MGWNAGYWPDKQSRSHHSVPVLKLMAPSLGSRGSGKKSINRRKRTAAKLAIAKCDIKCRVFSTGEKDQINSGSSAISAEDGIVCQAQILFGAQIIFAQTSRTHPRSQRCAVSASSRGCQSKATVNSGRGTGSGKLCMPSRRFPVCRSGTLAIRSEPRASASAVAKPPTIVTSFRSSPNVFKASSIGPLSCPSRETLMCRPVA